MHPIRCIFVLAVSVSTAFGAGDWQLVRFEGRDYVPVENIAKFYGFPLPPPLPVAAPETPTSPAAPEPSPAQSQPGNSPAPVDASSPQTIVPPGVTYSPSQTSTLMPVSNAAESRTVHLDNGKAQLSLSVNSREAQINGVKHWLSFPTHVQDGKLLVSRLDLVKIVEPRLRPERIQGLQPVTTVVLDPGHGGHDKGALSRHGYEKDFAMDVAKLTKERLERRGLKVLMTRSADIFIPLHERPRTANTLQNAIFVSIHFNSALSNPNARGFEIYSLTPRGAPPTNGGPFSARDLREEPGNAVDIQSSALSAAIYHSLLGNVPMEDRGIKHARFAVLRLCKIPAVLIECGFLSNGSESALVGTPAWRKKVAESIVTGIESYKDLAEQKHAPKMLADYRRASGSAPQSAP